MAPSLTSPTSAAAVAASTMSRSIDSLRRSTKRLSESRAAGTPPAR